MNLWQRIKNVLTDDDYVVKHSGPNRAKRRRLWAKVRRSRAKPKQRHSGRQAQAHEARHIFARAPADFPKSWQ